MSPQRKKFKTENHYTQQQKHHPEYTSAPQAAMAHPTRKLPEDELAKRSARGTQDKVLEKDDAELRLEKVLFGDEAGFMDSLKTEVGSREGALIRRESYDDSDSSNGDKDMEDVTDEQLFFLDSGTGEVPQSIARELEEDNEEVEERKKHPVWNDSDDERLTISLASNTRLRKLRDTEQDDVVTGTEYIRRLRRQYEHLHPTPEWVKYARKKRRTSKSEVVSESDSDISMDEGPSFSSAEPLSELLRSAGSFVRASDGPVTDRRPRRLRPEVLDIQRLKDVTNSGPSSIDTMQFHSYFPLLLTAGPSSTINLYHISPQPPNPNPLLTSLHVKNTPLHTAAFCRPRTVAEETSDYGQDGTHIFLSSRRRYFHTWSLGTGIVQKVSRPVFGMDKSEQKTMESFKISPDGRYIGLVGSGKKDGGVINVLSTETMQWVCACRIDSRGGVASFAWWRDGSGFAVIGKNGEISEYSIADKRVISRWTDEGAVGTTVLALGGESGKEGLGRDRWVATGSTSGIVNVYDRRDWSNVSTSEPRVPQRPKPTRTFDQLTTPTSHIEFSDDGQMMAMGSRWKKNALRLVHLPTCTVYRNWPTDKTPLGRISSIALSMDGGYLAVANEQGKVRLFQIRD